MTDTSAIGPINNYCRLPSPSSPARKVHKQYSNSLPSTTAAVIISTQITTITNSNNINTKKISNNNNTITNSNNINAITISNNNTITNKITTTTIQ